MDCQDLQPQEERRSRCPHAENAADYAVKKTFAILGVNIDNPREVREFQESLRFGDKMRKIADKSVLVFIAVLITAMAGAFLYGIKAKIMGQ
jgi:hypothetical protein